jgi:hypothetical protein
MSFMQLEHPNVAHRAAGRPGLGATLRSPARWAAALTLVISGATHIPVIPEHLQEAPYIGYLFIALTIACFALAAAVLVADSGTVWLTSGVVTALAVLAYVLSRTVGLPQIGDDVGNWTEPLGIAAITAEAVTAVIAVVVLRRHECTVEDCAQIAPNAACSGVP